MSNFSSFLQNKECKADKRGRFAAVFKWCLVGQTLLSLLKLYCPPFFLTSLKFKEVIFRHIFWLKDKSVAYLCHVIPNALLCALCAGTFIT